LAGAFFSSPSIVAGRAKLIRQLQKTKRSFVMCGLWSYPQIRGLDSFLRRAKLATM
jgi:hypothetical protein